MQESSAERISLIKNIRIVGDATDGIFFAKSGPGQQESRAGQSHGLTIKGFLWHTVSNSVIAG
jgi:hypothetical protein